MKYVVTNEENIIKYLSKEIKNKSKNNIKTMIVHNQVLVNGKIVNKTSHILKNNDIVEVEATRTNEFVKTSALDIVYEDDYIIVVNKKSGLLTIDLDVKGSENLYSIVTDYVKIKNKNNRIFIVHRLDKDTSGVIVFAKTQEIKEKLQTNWNENVLNRKYYAVVPNNLTEKTKTIKSYIKEEDNKISHSTRNEKDGKLAITEFKVIKENKKYALLDILISTGRKNQIRVHLSEIASPVVGDKKYGSQDNPIKRLALHAYNIEFVHPHSNKKLKFTLPIPKIFNSLMVNYDK